MPKQEKCQQNVYYRFYEEFRTVLQVASGQGTILSSPKLAGVFPVVIIETGLSYCRIGGYF